MELIILCNAIHSMPSLRDILLKNEKKMASHAVKIGRNFFIITKKCVERR